MKRADLIEGEFYAVKAHRWGDAQRMKLIAQKGTAEVPRRDWRGVVEPGKTVTREGIVVELEDGSKLVLDSARMVSCTWALFEYEAQVEAINATYRKRVRALEMNRDAARVDGLRALAGTGAIELGGEYASGGIACYFPRTIERYVGALRKVLDSEDAGQILDGLATIDEAHAAGVDEAVREREAAVEALGERPA